MKKLLTILLMFFCGLAIAQTGENPPTGTKILQAPNSPTFLFYQPDTSIWISMGAYGKAELQRANKKYPIWNHTGISNTGWTPSKVLGFDVSGNLVPVAAGSGSMVYPAAGIAVSNGSGWATSITDNSANWNTAYAWGNHAGLYRPVSWVPSWTDITSKPTFATVATSGSYTDLINKPTIPTNTNQLTNGAGFITGYTETDPTIYAWAKAATKPSYTYAEVGAQATLVSGTNIKTINGSSLLGAGDLTITGGAGTVTSVSLKAPTGFSVSGSPVTSSGTLTFSYASGYSLPTTASQLTWNDAYSNMGKTSTDGSFFAYLNPSYFTALGGWKPTTLNEPTPFSDKAFSAGGAYIALNAKQDALNGTGFVKISGTTISYDNNNYALLNGSLSQDFSGRSFLLPNSINVNGNDGIARLVNGGHSFALFSNGDASVDGIFTASELYRGSSKELKHNIKPYKGNALDILNATKIYTYNLNSDNSFGVGFLAEDTHEWLSGENQKSHAMGNHLGLLTKAIQEQIIVIEEMQKQISYLQIEIKKLKKRQLNRK